MKDELLDSNNNGISDGLKDRILDGYFNDTIYAISDSSKDGFLDSTSDGISDGILDIGLEDRNNEGIDSLKDRFLYGTFDVI